MVMGKLKFILEGQWLHLLLLVVFLNVVLRAESLEGIASGDLWGIATPIWFWAAIIIPIIHQVYVWFCWRTQLHLRLLTRLFGNSAFAFYAIGFSIIGIIRVLLVFLLAYANRDTVDVNHILLQSLAVLLILPAIYLFYSVSRYFGYKRAFGIDHFDESYRHEAFVRKGIFRISENSMYTFGFLLLWVPALWFASIAALLVALFSHLYIWVHYYTTELPDIRRIYGK
jgi:protein-S-isoprenylcysteine O-methyltransferase Ste14